MSARRVNRDLIRQNQMLRRSLLLATEKMKEAQYTQLRLEDQLRSKQYDQNLRRFAVEQASQFKSSSVSPAQTAKELFEFLVPVGETKETK